MKLVTSEQMRSIDRETIDNRGIPGPELMENAGRGIAERIAPSIIDAASEESIAVFCGKGNNGGDGFVVARYLHQEGARVQVHFMGPIESMSLDARLNFDRAAGAGVELHELKSADDLPETLETEYIIDAVFGTGFSGSPRGLAGDVIDYINRCPQTTIAVDMPSGLNADSGRHEGSVVQADYTFTLGLPKYGLYVSPGRELAGIAAVVPIGIPDDVIAGFDLKTDLITHAEVASMLPPRPPDAHKGTFGKVFVLAGSIGMTGAAALAARSAFRCGCGLAKIGCPTAALPLIASQVLEATSWPLPDVARKGALALRGLGEVRKLASEHDAVAIGPGIGQHRETAELIRRFVSKLDKPAVIDADGLNALAGHMDAVKNREGKAPLILTPHPGEFCRIAGVEKVPEDIHERIDTARRFASEYNVILVLKGSPTIVTEPSGRAWLNPTGNEGMATGGAGDVLTGAIGSFLAQGMSGIEATLCGVYVHGLAGDLAAEELTSRAMIAGDIVEFLPGVFEMLG